MLMKTRRYFFVEEDDSECLPAKTWTEITLDVHLDFIFNSP